MNNLSISYWKLFSALATADDIVFFTSFDILFSEKVKSLIASPTFFPTIDFSIGFSFLVLDLTFSDKRISKDIKKTISSAVANAENNYQYDIDKLIVKEAYCGKQVVMKRFRARAKGRAAEIMKPYSNVTIILTEKAKEKMESHGSKS